MKQNLEWETRRGQAINEKKKNTKVVQNMANRRQNQIKNKNIATWNEIKTAQ